MATGDELLDAIKEVTSSRPLTLDGVSRLMGRELLPARQGSNNMFAVFQCEQSDSPFFSWAELRIPQPKSSAKGALLILVIQPHLDVGMNDIRRLFGEESRVTFPYPNEPPDA